MARNLYSLQLLRNTNIYADKATAIAALSGVSTQDGVIVLARYYGDTAHTQVKTMFGVNYVAGATTTGDTGHSYTFYDADSEEIKRLKVASDDQTLDVVYAESGTNLSVNIDESTIVKDANDGTLKADLEVVKLTATEVAALSDTNVKDAYKMIAHTDTARTAIGEVIKIYKDSALQDVYLGHVDDTINATTGEITSGTGDTALCFVYLLADGTYDLTAVNVEEFLEESEFKDGLQVVNHEVSVKKDATSGKVKTGDTASDEVDVLTVSSGGVKVANIQEAIDYALTKAVGEITSSNASISATTAATADGTIQYDLVTDANKIKMSGFTADTTGLTAITEASTVTEAVKAIETAMISNELVVSAALNDLDTTKIDVIEVNHVASKTSAATDVVASVEIGGSDIKLSGYTVPASPSAVTSADTVNEAIGKLEAQIAVAGLEQVESGNGISVSTVVNRRQTISAVATPDASTVSGVANPISVTTNGIEFAGVLDCGTY